MHGLLHQLDQNPVYRYAQYCHVAGSSFSTGVDHLFDIAYNKRVRDCSSEAIHNHP